MRVALDIHGGDNAPSVVLEGAKNIIREVDDIEIVLIGREEIVKDYFKDKIPECITVHNATEVIGSSENPLQALKDKKSSTIAEGMKLVKKGKADIFISAGHSGAVMAAALLILGRIENVSRPALLTVLPTIKNGGTIIIDVGANTVCRSHNFLEFARMGKIYAKYVLEIEEPKIGLLSNGQEDNKGTQLIQEVNIILKEREKNFIGNIEGRDIPYGKVDIVLCDGFTGNILLKFAEGLALSMYDFMKQDLKRHPINLIGVLFLRNLLRRFKNKIDWKKHGGAPLLGVNGNVIIAHGSSDSTAISNSIKTGYKFVKRDILSKLKDELS